MLRTFTETRPSTIAAVREIQSEVISLNKLQRLAARGLITGSLTTLITLPFIYQYPLLAIVTALGAIAAFKSKAIKEDIELQLSGQYYQLKNHQNRN